MEVTMRELVLNCSAAHAEALSDALLGAGVLSVSVEDADQGSEAEQALFGEPGTEPEVRAWQSNHVVALLPDGADPELILEQIRAVHDYKRGTWSVRDVPDADWVRLTQSQFAPIQVGRRVWIVPSWHRDDAAMPSCGAEETSIRIELDPGLAFGTGSHPTTQLCLEWLEENLALGATVLDYGCGSGILAIAAKLLGGADVRAVDIDEQAVQASRYNAEVNRVAIEALLPDQLPPVQTDIVVANILSSPLKVLAPMLAGRVLPGGHLVLSGILERQAYEVAQAYAPWLMMSVWRSRAGWVCLHGQRALAPK
jgi:ribosomal protein L11 methyltransferase